MTQIFDGQGNAIPVTLVQAGPCFVTQEKSLEKDGYRAVQIGFGQKKEKKTAKAQQGRAKKAGLDFIPQYWREFECEQEMKPGTQIKADVFEEGDSVKVSGLSKGKGFAGVVKRHHFGGAPATHGQKHSLRQPGSIGATFPERVPKGRRMAGRMGFEQITVEGLKVVKVDADNNILAIKGAVPGKRGTLLAIVSEK